MYCFVLKNDNSFLLAFFCHFAFAFLNSFLYLTKSFSGKYLDKECHNSCTNVLGNSPFSIILFLILSKLFAKLNCPIAPILFVILKATSSNMCRPIVFIKSFTSSTSSESMSLVGYLSPNRFNNLSAPLYCDKPLPPSSIVLNGLAFRLAA